MQHSLMLLISAILFGISNGLSPGPTLILVISHTLQHDYREGVKVACGPLLFGLTIVPISILFLINIDEYKPIMGFISIIGAIFIGYLGFKQLFLKNMKLVQQGKKLNSLKIGIFANFSNPYAYIFWFTIGAPLIVSSKSPIVLATVFFVVIYYFCLIGSKIVVALIVEKFRSVIEKIYNYIMFILGVGLLIFAYLIFKDGILLLL